MSSRWGLLLAAGAVGLCARAYGFDRSLWLDEFSTWWVVAAPVSEVPSRVASFHGQAPLYYLVAKGSVALIGETEVALRAPSVAASLLTAVAAGLLGGAIAGRQAGFLAAALCWLAFDQVQTGVNARPYALAILGTTLATLGFVRATASGQWPFRVILVGGTVIAFWAQFALVLSIAGLALAYALMPRLRRMYRPRQALLDAAMGAILCTLALPYIAASMARAHHVEWLPAPQHGEVLALLAPFALPLGQVASGRQREPIGPHVVALALSITAVVAGVELLWLFGANLVTPRYVGPVVPLAAVLAAVALTFLNRRERWLAVTAFALMTGVSYGRAYLWTGTFSGIGVEDWRSAVRTARGQLEAHRIGLVLYRSGFVEEDLPRPGTAHPATRSPLQGPGVPPLQADIVSLTHRWSREGRNEYFRRVVRPKILNAPGLVIVAQRTEDVDGSYTANLIEWLKVELGQDLRVFWPPQYRGVDVVVVTQQRPRSGTSFEP